MFNYIRNGQEIYNLSFAIIRRETDLSHIPDDLEKVVVRIIHACGMVDIAKNFAFSNNAGYIGKQALQAGAPLLCDSRMVAEGIIRKRLPAENQVLCTLNNPKVPELAKKLGCTRSAAALEYWHDFLPGSIAVIGNAPTALFRLLEIVKDDFFKPALILGFPVGFIGAAESKEALVQHHQNIPYITLHGRRGGSAIAAAAVNALASEKE
ncbi:MAG: precorrin-8X/cobalt-precorrin-8 methylmutase [Candidatus Tokpelaia sp. JSC188]|nr:MAG: precorrin-8X/cobalt-precorrin-8 methylmutase [Candidatus Tokpelaia sp. JSC188]